MFCYNCGTKLPDDATVCHDCGASVTVEDIPAPAPSMEDTLPLEDLLAEVKESFHLEEPAAEEEADVPLEEVELDEEEESTYAAPVFVEPNPKKQKKQKQPREKKKANKVVRILVPILAVVLLLGAAFGVLYLANETYAKANECLAAKDYEQAQELFGRFSIFKTFKEQEEHLIAQQLAYDQAGTLVQQNAYLEALKGYATLGDYRDSLYLLNAEVPYKQASYLRDNAVEENTAALAQIPGYDPASTDSQEILLYKAAAELFNSLGDHQDSAAQSSNCYMLLASAYMGEHRFEEALACHDRMNEADKELSVIEYLTYCEDETLLNDIAKVIRLRRDLEEGSEEVTHRDLVYSQLDILSYYTEEDLMYYDMDLKDQAAAFVKALEKELGTTDEEGNCTDTVTWYLGSSERCAVIEQLIERYDLLSDDTALQASFAGKSAYYAAAAEVEKALNAQLLNVEGETDKADGDHLPFENTTGYTFALSVRNEFFNEEGESVFLHQTEPIPVEIGATVKIPLLFPEDSDWTKWTTSWEYEISLG